MRIRVLRGWGNVVIWAERVSRVGRVSTGCLLLSLVCSPINFPVGTTGYLASAVIKFLSQTSSLFTFNFF